ncbi:MAG: type II secretion system protein [Myxococcales bacterium]|nr:type II secretion system protein [Myxococcales bacterium]
MRRPHVPDASGFTLIEACLLLSGLGIFLAMAAPAFVDALRTSKTAEAGELLGRMVRGANAYYVAFHDVETQEGTRKRGQCLPPDAGPVPSVPGPDAQTIDFGAETTPGAETWTALGFEPPHPVHYAYSFTPTATGCMLADGATKPTIVHFVARGDLDGDGTLSEFRRVGTAGPTGLELDPLLVVDRRVE